MTKFDRDSGYPKILGHHSLLTELLVAIYSVDLLVEMQLWQSNAWNYSM